MLVCLPQRSKPITFGGLPEYCFAFGVCDGDFEIADWLADNPARGVKKLRGGKSYEPWPDSALERFRKCASPRMVLAMELALHTGQRQGDVLAMQWRHIVGGLIEVAQSKTGERLSIPIHCELAEILGRTPREHMFVVHTGCGTPYTASGSKCMFHREIRRPGLDGLVFHGLRHTACHCRLKFPTF